MVEAALAAQRDAHLTGRRYQSSIARPKRIESVITELNKTTETRFASCARCSPPSYKRLNHRLLFIHQDVAVSLEVMCRICRLFKILKETVARTNARYYCEEREIRFRHDPRYPGVFFSMMGANVAWEREIWLYANELPNFSGLDSPVSQASIASAVNWERIIEWIRHCSSEHTACRESFDAKHIVGFQVIDCNTRRLVSADLSSDYVALSYVWGTDPFNCMPQGIPTPAPKLIEDAITCTLATGFKFLWVDRYCIDQTSASKHTIIQNMDKIYANAAMTIIDSAGEGPSYGLPGASTHSCRQLLQSFTVDGVEFLFLPSPWREVSESKWNQRGWTFQEGQLSRRRLVFSKTNLFFQCQEMYMSDAIPFTIAGNKHNWEHSTANKKLWIYPRPCFNHLREVSGDIATLLISQYLRKTLSYESDTINAIMGILNRIGHHFWGVIFSSLGRNTGQLNQRLLGPERGNGPGFIGNLLWVPISTSSGKTVTRRKGFPSWSWAGWSNLSAISTGVYSNLLDPKDQDVFANWILPERFPYYDDEFDMKVGVYDNAQRILSVHECIREINQGASMYRFGPRLRIEGWFASVSTRLLELSFACQDDVSPVRALDELGQHEIGIGTIMIENAIHSDEARASKLLEQVWPALLFLKADSRNDGHPGGLILKAVDDNTYERIGTLERFGRIPRWIWEQPSNGNVGFITIEYRNVDIGADERGARCWRLPCEKRTICLV